ncbi:hypothetical protein CDL15_Pgr014797 [Punica granatum]|nr:hypothetical protein CDL15_Pgr014797 [Punica granatum]
MDSSSSPSGDMLACSRPLMERRLRPQHDQPLKCPRCESTHTKFCYYNNYSLSQPRYFCKTCRRYWTKGGTLRNIPVGGGCRKNKKASSSKKPSEHHNSPMMIQNPGSSSSSSGRNPTDLHLSFPHDIPQLSSHFGSLLGNGSFGAANGFLEGKFGPGPGPIDFMESKLEAIVGNNPSRNNYDFMGNNTASEQVQLGVLSSSGYGDLSGNGFSPNFHGLCSPYGIISSSAIDVPNNVGASFIENNYQSAMDVKPNPKLLSLEWQDQNCSDAGKNNVNTTFGGYSFNGLGSSWTGMINEYSSPATNPLV